MIKGKQRVTRSSNHHSLAISIKLENAHAIVDKSIDGECPICHDPAQVVVLDLTISADPKNCQMTPGSNLPSFERSSIQFILFRLGFD